MADRPLTAAAGLGQRHRVAVRLDRDRFGRARRSHGGCLHRGAVPADDGARARRFRAQTRGHSMHPARLTLPAFVLLSVLPAFAAPPDHDSIERWVNAVGGRERVRSIDAIYREATIQVAGGEGALKAWHTADGRYRKEERDRKSVV